MVILPATTQSINLNLPKNSLRPVISLALFFVSVPGTAQQPYWQQQLRYNIEVSLDDNSHSLSGTLELLYKNNSPQHLDFIWFHLWPNAYKNEATALAKQKMGEGDEKLRYATSEERGYLDSLRFSVNGQPLQTEAHPLFIDVCKVMLPAPLKSGDSILITTPFYVKIPDAKFSRLGHTQQAYYITQWYPKPAVFDRDGWHPMPYLDQGEFYSEFGTFDVKITLPSNYVLAATGDRVNADKEETFLAVRIRETMDALSAAGNGPRRADPDTFPVSSAERKTVHFHQEKVHDFAWFADKRFLVAQDSVLLPGGHLVKSYAYFTKRNAAHWKDGAAFVARAVKFYSRKVGPYPYRHATAVDGTIMAGGGMEYPNITVIGNVSSPVELDMVIAHEVGHNWFYGMLASNERDFPYMDEGMNSAIEMQYLREYYPLSTIAGLVGLGQSSRLFGVHRIPYWRYHGISWSTVQRVRKAQPLNLGSTSYSGNNYGAMVYSRSAVTFDYLEQIAPERFQNALHGYYKDFRFRHPQPQDLRASFILNGVVDSTAYDQLVSEDRAIGYKLCAAKVRDGVIRLKVRNNGEIASPFLLRLSSGDTRKDTIIAGFTGERWLSLFPAEKFQIDPDKRMPELQRNDNTIRARGLFRRMEPFRLQGLSGFSDPDHTLTYWLPATGFNHYNGLMAGLVLHNYSFDLKRFEWAVVPLYAIRSKSPAGLADMDFKFFPKGIVRQVSLGFGARSFALNDRSWSTGREGIAHYYKVAPFISLQFRVQPLSRAAHELAFTNHRLAADSTATLSWNPFGDLQRWQVNELLYKCSFRRSRSLHFHDFNVQQAGDVVKAGLTSNFRLPVTSRHNIQLRVFAGAFLSGSQARRQFYSLRAAGYNGYQDYLLSGHYFGRNEMTGVGFSQFADREGALKIWTPLGQSTEWLVAVNVKSPKAGRLPLRLFADIVTCEQAALGGAGLLWDAGINLQVVPNLVEVYYAVVYSEVIRRSLESNGIGVFNRLRFTFNIDKLVPKRVLREIAF